MQELRNQIDILDKQISQLLEQRFMLCKKIGDYKKTHNIPVVATDREEQILSRFENQQVKNVYREILTQSKLLQK